MGNPTINSKSKRLWSAHIIGWTTLFFGVVSGFVIAAINWARMGYKIKALIHFLIAIIIACLYAFILQDYLGISSSLSVPEFSIRLIIGLVLVFLAIAYLHTATRKDIENLRQHGENIEDWNWSLAAVFGIIFFMACNSLNNFGTAYRISSFQHHLSCEILKAGMTSQEVDNALNTIGPHKFMEMGAYFVPHTQTPPAYYRAIMFEDVQMVQKYDLYIGLGYDANNKLIWVSHAQPFQIIRCP